MKDNNVPYDFNFPKLYKALTKCNVVSVRIVYSKLLHITLYYEVVCRTDSGYKHYYLKPLSGGGISVEETDGSSNG